MDEQDRTGTQEDEELVRRLLAEAGPRPPLPEEDLEAITAAARAAWRANVRPRVPAKRARRPLWLPLAAALAVAVGLASWWISRGNRAPVAVARVEEVSGTVHLGSRQIAAGDPVPLGAELRSGETGRAALRLTGDVDVRLDAETRLRFVSAAILELESGGLYVDSGSGKGSIEVRTAIGTARDVGTQFLVRIADGAALLVRVREGSVLTERGGQTYLIPAGRELVLRRDGTSEQRAAAGHGPGWDWVLGVSGVFDIEGRTLPEFLAWVSRETGWRVVLDGDLAEEAPEIVLHGSLGGLRADQAPFVLLPGAGLEGDLRAGTLTVRRRQAPR